MTGWAEYWANVVVVEGFLSLDEAAEQLETTPDELQQEISAGRAVAIVREGQSWLSPGEVSRLVKAAELRRRREAATDEEPPTKPIKLATVEQETEPAVRGPAHNSGPSPQEMELRQRYQALAEQHAQLEKINQRLKVGLQETEATLRRSRMAKTNLENDIISLQEQLKKAQTRSAALEREVQHLSHELERAEERHSQELRRFRNYDRGRETHSNTGSNEAASEEIEALRRQMEEKDRIISHEYQERAVLRSQLEDRNQKYFELKAIYEKEKGEWSEILARELQTHGQLKSQLEELRPKTQKGWNPFRREK